MRYFPGETNARLAEVVVINKVGTARPEDVDTVERNVKAMNPGATVIRGKSPIAVDDPEMVRGKRVLVVEDGPTLTHGEMKIGAGHVAAKQFGAAELVDPRPYAVGSIKDTFAKYDHLSEVLPAMGYGDKQRKELEDTINAVDCDVVLIGTPIDLTRLLKIDKPAVRVLYELDKSAAEELRPFVEKAVR
jgi:predicted GTPase